MRKQMSGHGIGMFLGMGASCGLLLASGLHSGCGGDAMDPNSMMMPPPVVMKTCTADKVTGTSNKLATDALKLPASTGGKTFSYDFDGDGKPENQLKNLLNAVSLADINLQDSVNNAVANGDAIVLMDVKTADPMNQMCTSITMSVAKAPEMMDPKPKFDGKDTFKVGTVMGVTVYASLTAGKLNSTASKDQTPANEQKIEIVLPLGLGASLPLALHGAHVEGTMYNDNGVLRLKDGVLHGVLSKKDIDEKIIPLVANLLTGLINKSVGMDGLPDSTGKAIIAFFESKTGAASKAKCMVAADCCATNPKTCKIVNAEVVDSPIGGVLAPDVQVFDKDGSWKPVAGGKDVNGMSVGIGFSSVQAMF